ncbi:hypothetical protein EV191_101628 [Tamaricihabitans halophyticus]|uniref:Uncharacterized protein n=2 Tax=Tamaricihabitans halophyticus TaxID=1262583 RepID=A0A4R2R1W0_9PSEU|nr:hypothetical protein EV191_101628 [Tamaricihabitans halophyticus]
MTTLERLASAFWDQVRSHALPDPVHVQFDPREETVVVQVRLTRDVGPLLAWADTLDGVRAEWWHTDTGDLHLTVTGRGPRGVRFRLYSGLRMHQCEGLVSLAEDQQEPVSLDQLRSLNAQFQVPAHRPGRLGVLA